MSTSLMSIAASLTRWWVRQYTKGLPSEVRVARHAEIESDLWEHARDAADLGYGVDVTASQMLGRLLFGMPADLSWRSEQHRAVRHAETGGKNVMGGTVSMGKLAHRGFIGVAVLLGLMALSVGVGAGLGLVDNEQGTIWRDVTLSLSAGVALLAGIWTIERSPLLGGGLVVFGAIVIGLGTLWTMIVPVVMALVAMGAFVRAITVIRERNSLV